MDRLHFIGTATTVTRLGSFTLLTDPHFLHRGQRAHLGWGLSSPRLGPGDRAESSTTLRTPARGDVVSLEPADRPAWKSDG